MNNPFLSISDIALVPIYLVIIFFFSFKKKNKYIASQPYYKYYIMGLTSKLLGSMGLCMVYLFYYVTGGDTLNYFVSSKSMLNLMVADFSGFLDIMIRGNQTAEQYSLFTNETGWPYYWEDPYSFYLIRLICLITLISFKSYLATSLIVAWISYAGVWRLYTVFCKEFPAIPRDLAIALLFIPSVAFWGSGVLKDTVTYSACCWFTYAFYNLIYGKNRIQNLSFIIISCYLIMVIKPYILYAIFPGAGVWIVSFQLQKVKSVFVRYSITPILIAVGVGSVILLLQELGKNFGKWSLDGVLERAVITQTDLIRGAYGGNSFDIGQFDASIEGVLSKAPVAIIAGLFRPFLWEAKNPVMFVSGLENLYILLFAFYLIFKLRVINVLVLARKNSLLLYSISFAIIFAFLVGLTTSNFGSLVRYRIPAMPFSLASLFILKELANTKKKTLGVYVV